MTNDQIENAHNTMREQFLRRSIEQILKGHPKYYVRNGLRALVSTLCREYVIGLKRDNRNRIPASEARLVSEVYARFLAEQTPMELFRHTADLAKEWADDAANGSPW